MARSKLSLQDGELILPHGLNPTLKFVLARDEDQSMKLDRFTEEQIIGILKEHEAGVSVADLGRKHGVSDASRFGRTRPSG